MAKKSSFWKDFKAFITRGNVLDMAVGVVIGGAFGKISTGLVNYIINPLVGLFIKSGDLDSVRTVLKEAVYAEDGVTVVEPEVALLWGTWLQTILDFLIISFCIFLVLRILMRIKNGFEADKIAEEARKAAEAEAKAAADKQAAEEAAKALAEKQARLEEATLHQEQLLAEIRDLMKNK